MQFPPIIILLLNIQLQIYSRKLEEALDETLQNLYIEKERHDELLHSTLVDLTSHHSISSCDQF